MCHVSHWGKHLKHLGGNIEPDCSYLAVAVQSTWFDFCETTQDRKWRLRSEHPPPKDCAHRSVILQFSLCYPNCGILLKTRNSSYI